MYKRPGEGLKLTCTFNNTTDSTVSFGEGFDERKRDHSSECDVDHPEAEPFAQAALPQHNGKEPCQGNAKTESGESQNISIFHTH